MRKARIMAVTAKLRVVPTLRELAESFSSRRILVVGDLVADHYIYGQTERLSREAPVLIVRYQSSEVKLGGAANAAANVRSLGAQVTAVGILGDDDMGRQLRRLFDEAGIRVIATVAEGAETQTKTRILAGGVNTTRQQMLRLDRGSTALSAAQRQQLAEEIREAARGSGAVLVSDYGAGVLSDETRTVLRQLAAEGVPVCVDSRFSLDRFTGLTWCKPNQPELEALLGRPLRSDIEVLEGGRRALEMLKCQAMMLTRGRSGMAVFTSSGDEELLPVHGLAEAVDVTGAGDTVMAALTLAMASGATPLEAAKIANIAGGLAVQKQGTATVSRSELLGELGNAA